MVRRAFRDGVVYPKNPNREELKLREAIARDELDRTSKGIPCFRMRKQTSPRNLSFAGDPGHRLSHLDYYKKRVTLAPNPFGGKK